MRAVITCKKDADVDAILKLLFKYSDLECTFGINMVAIAGGKPRQLGLLDIIRYYVQYQRTVVLRRTRFELKEAQARCHILEGLIIGVHNIDEVVRIIKTAESTPDARRKLMERFSLTERQAQAILDLRLARLAKLEIKKLENELEELRKLIARLQEIVGDIKKQWELVTFEIREIKRKYKSDRKTRIVEDETKIAVKRADVRGTVSDIAVCVNANNNIKFMERGEFTFAAKRRVPVSASLNQLHKITTFCSSDDIVYAFTNIGNVVRMNVKYVDISEFKSSGQPFEKIVEGVEKDENPVRFFALKDGETPEGDLIFFTRQGAVKRTSWSEYVQGKVVMPAIKLKEGDEVLSVERFDDDEYSTMLFVTRKGLCLNAVKDEVPVQGRVAGGVKGIALSGDDEVIFATQHTGEGEVIIVTSLNGVKRVVASTIEPIGRACKGVMIADIKGKGEILFADYVTIPYSVAFVNDNKTVIEVNTEDIPIETRVFKGKPLKVPGMANILSVYALKHRSDFPDGRQQIKI